MNKHLSLVLLALLLGFFLLSFSIKDSVDSTQTGVAQNNENNPPSPFNVASNGFEQDSANYLGAIAALKIAESDYKTESNKWLYLQAAMTYNAFVQNNDEYHKLLSEFYKSNREPNVSSCDSTVINFIKEKAGSEKVIMFNEQHWQNKHRFFGNLMLEYLYNQGFRYLAVEAVNTEDEKNLNERKYPLQKTGFYTRDPQFGNMLRNALRLGFQVIGYDDYSNSREHNQAQNIYKIIKDNQDAKIVVWAGVQHIDERVSNKPKMAHHFKTISDIDPFTVEQTQGDYTSDFIKCKLGIDADSSHRWNCDLFIHNNLKESDYKIDPTKQDAIFKIKLSPNVIQELELHKKLIISVFYKSEFETHHLACVPVLNKIIQDSSEIELKLPVGNDFIAIIRTPSGIIIDQYNLD